MSYLMLLGYVAGIFTSMIIFEIIHLVRVFPTVDEDRDWFIPLTVIWPISIPMAILMCISMMISKLAQMIAKWIVRKLS